MLIWDSSSDEDNRHVQPAPLIDRWTHGLNFTSKSTTLCPNRGSFRSYYEPLIGSRYIRVPIGKPDRREQETKWFSHCRLVRIHLMIFKLFAWRTDDIIANILELMGYASPSWVQLGLIRLYDKVWTDAIVKWSRDYIIVFVELRIHRCKAITEVLLSRTTYS